MVWAGGGILSRLSAHKQCRGTSNKCSAKGGLKTQAPAHILLALLHAQFGFGAPLPFQQQPNAYVQYLLLLTSLQAVGQRRETPGLDLSPTGWETQLSAMGQAAMA